MVSCPDSLLAPLQVFEDTTMHPVTLLQLNSQLASLLLLPLWLFNDGAVFWSLFAGAVGSSGALHPARAAAADPLPQPPAEALHQFLGYLFLSGLLSFGQNLCAFTLIHQLTTLSYAVSNAAKRVAVILVSLLLMRNPVTWLNLCGMLLSVLGVFCYNRIKHAERLKRAKSPLVVQNDGLNGQLDESAAFLRRPDRQHLHLGGMRSTNSDVR